MTDERNESIEIDGRRFAWRALGGGPKLVLLNGYSTTSRDWDPTLLGVLSESFEVICPDHRGMGESDLGAADELSIDGMADDVERLLDAIGAESAPIGGWSMGGFVAQRLAVRSPDRVDALVLLGTDPGGPEAVRATPEAWAQLTDLTGTSRERASRLIPLLFPAALVPAIEGAFGDLMAESLGALSPEALVAQKAAMAVWHATPPTPPDPATAPKVLVMSGSEDVVIPAANDAALSAVWPTCDVETFEGGGHAFFALEPQRTADRIKAFLTS